MNFGKIVGVVWSLIELFDAVDSRVDRRERRRERKARKKKVDPRHRPPPGLRH